MSAVSAGAPPVAIFMRPASCATRTPSARRRRGCASVANLSASGVDALQVRRGSPKQTASGEASGSRFWTRPFLHTAHRLRSGAKAGADSRYASGSSPCSRTTSPAASPCHRWIGRAGRSAESSRLTRLNRPRACEGAVLLVLTRRLLVFLLPEPGERKGRAGWERRAAPSPCSRGPEAPLPRAHPRALWSRVGCGAGLFGVGERRTWRSDPLCASGRGHSSGTARRCVPYGLSTGPADARPHPLSRQSRGLSAIDRLPASAMPLPLPPFVQTGEGRPRSPRKEHLVGRAPSARGLLSSVAP